VLLLSGFVLVCFWVGAQAEERILDAASVKNPVDAIVVFGAGVKGHTLSAALRFRMDTAITLFRNNLARRIVLTGDGTSAYYKETDAMYLYALNSGVSAAQIEADPKGYSSIESVLRLKKHFGVSSAYFVSQRAHLPRLLFLAHHANIPAFGVPAQDFEEIFSFKFREMLARVKEFIIVFTNATPDGMR
jgi:SanA protein